MDLLQCERGTYAWMRMVIATAKLRDLLAERRGSAAGRRAHSRSRDCSPPAPPLAQRAVKVMMRRAIESTLDYSLGDALQAVLWVGPSADAAEGKAAFLAKRPPNSPAGEASTPSND